MIITILKLKFVTISNLLVPGYISSEQSSAMVFYVYVRHFLFYFKDYFLVCYILLPASCLCPFPATLTSLQFAVVTQSAVCLNSPVNFFCFSYLWNYKDHRCVWGVEHTSCLLGTAQWWPHPGSSKQRYWGRCRDKAWRSSLTHWCRTTGRSSWCLIAPWSLLQDATGHIFYTAGTQQPHLLPQRKLKKQRRKSNINTSNIL